MLCSVGLSLMLSSGLLCVGDCLHPSALIAIPQGLQNSGCAVPLYQVLTTKCLDNSNIRAALVLCSTPGPMFCRAKDDTPAVQKNMVGDVPGNFH